MMGAFLEKKVDFVMRVPSCKLKEFEEFMQSTELDSLCYINREKKGWCGYVRVVRYTIRALHVFIPLLYKPLVRSSYKNAKP